MTFAAPYSRRIIGGPSKAQNIRVMRGFCQIGGRLIAVAAGEVQPGDPGAVQDDQGIHALRRNIDPAVGLPVPTKNSLCWPMNLMCASDSWKNFWLKGRSRLPGWLTSIGARPGAEPFRLPRIDARRSMALPFRLRPQWRRWEMCRRKFGLRYLYRRIVLRGGVRLPLEAAKRLVGPDCAFHLYASVNDQNEATSTCEPPAPEVPS